MSIASLRRAKKMLEKALEDLKRAGMDTGYSQNLISVAIEIIDEHTGDNK